MQLLTVWSKIAADRLSGHTVQCASKVHVNYVQKNAFNMGTKWVQSMYVSTKCLQSAWKVHGTCLESVCKVDVKCVQSESNVGSKYAQSTL